MQNAIDRIERGMNNSRLIRSHREHLMQNRTYGYFAAFCLLTGVFGLHSTALGQTDTVPPISNTGPLTQPDTMPADSTPQVWTERSREGPESGWDDDSARLRFSIGAQIYYGRIDGYAQTPLGGEPGSTSHQRPRFSELGMDNAWSGRVSFAANWQHQEGFADAEDIGMRASDTLRSGLTTHGTDFSAGTRVHSRIDLGWFRAGYRYHFDFARASNDRPQLTLAPYADLGALDFYYRIHGDGSFTRREYVKVAPQLGLIASWRPNGGRFSIDADLSASPPGISSIPFVAAEQITANYEFLRRPRFVMIGSLGVRFEQVNFYDDQRVPNHVRANFGPAGVLGIAFRF